MTEPKAETLIDVLENSVKIYKRKTAIIFFGKKLNYQDLKNQVLCFASGLKKLGIQKGDRVGIILPNCPQNIIAYFAILKLGGIVVQFNPQYTSEEIANQLRDSGAKILIGLNSFSERFKNLNQTPLNCLILTSVGPHQ